LLTALAEVGPNPSGSPPYGCVCTKYGKSVTPSAARHTAIWARDKASSSSPNWMMPRWFCFWRGWPCALAFPAHWNYSWIR